jgi:hypothetical protein
MGAASLENFIIGFIRVYLLTLNHLLPLFRPSGQPQVAPPHARPGIRLWFTCAALGQSRMPRRTSAFHGEGKKIPAVADSGYKN